MLERQTFQGSYGKKCRIFGKLTLFWCLLSQSQLRLQRNKRKVKRVKGRILRVTTFFHLPSNV